MRDETSAAFAKLSQQLTRDPKALDKAFDGIFSALESEPEQERPAREDLPK